MVLWLDYDSNVSFGGNGNDGKRFINLPLLIGHEKFESSQLMSQSVMCYVIMSTTCLDHVL